MAHRPARLSWLLASFLALSSVEASQVRPLDLAQLTERADRIFAGRCVRASVVFDRDAGGPVTVATFLVDRRAKGRLGGTVTIKMASSAVDRGFDSPSEPAFHVGEEVVLFLYGESALGLSAPVGLGQGRFEVVTDKHGKKHAQNEFRNENLPASGRTHRDPGLLDPTSLLDRVDRLLAEE